MSTVISTYPQRGRTGRTEISWTQRSRAFKCRVAAFPLASLCWLTHHHIYFNNPPNTMHGFSVSSWISAISAESSWKSANSSWKSANRSLCYLIIMSPQWCMHSSKILHVLWANSSWKSANSSWAQKPENRKAQIKRPTPIVSNVYILYNLDMQGSSFDSYSILFD